MDKVRFATDERLDLVDALRLTQFSANHFANLIRRIFGQPGSSGLGDTSVDVSIDGVTDRGFMPVIFEPPQISISVAPLPATINVEIRKSTFRNALMFQGDGQLIGSPQSVALRSVTVSALTAAGTYYIKVRRVSSTADSASRRFWDRTTETEYSQAMDTRTIDDWEVYQPSGAWDLDSQVTSATSDTTNRWITVGQITVSGGSVTDANNYITAGNQWRESETYSWGGRTAAEMRNFRSLKDIYDAITTAISEMRNGQLWFVDPTTQAKFNSSGGITFSSGDTLNPTSGDLTLTGASLLPAAMGQELGSTSLKWSGIFSRVSCKSATEAAFGASFAAYSTAPAGQIGDTVEFLGRDPGIQGNDYNFRIGEWGQPFRFLPFFRDDFFYESTTQMTNTAWADDSSGGSVNLANAGYSGLGGVELATSTTSGNHGGVKKSRISWVNTQSLVLVVRLRHVTNMADREDIVDLYDSGTGSFARLIYNSTDGNWRLRIDPDGLGEDVNQSLFAPSLNTWYTFEVRILKDEVAACVNQGATARYNGGQVLNTDMSGTPELRLRSKITSGSTEKALQVAFVELFRGK